MAKDKLSAEVRAKIEERLYTLSKINCFDGKKLESRPTPTQQEILNDFCNHVYKFQAVMGGNQCLAKGTLIATPTGPIEIENIKIGDTVYDENGNPIKVLKTFSNGPKQVHTLTNRGVQYARATEGHKFLIKDGHNRMHERNVYAFKRDDRVKRVSLTAPLGEVTVPDAYVIGAMIGDGCCRQRTKGMHISSANELIPSKCATLLNSSCRKLHDSNYTWELSDRCSYFSEWLHGTYAHEKDVDMSILRTWDRKSLIAFIAGVYDTDGSLTKTKDILSFAITMQAKYVLKALEWAILAVWGIPVQWHTDARDKYKNGNVYSITIKNPHYIKQMMGELDAEVVSPQKKWDDAFLNVCGKRSSVEWVGLAVSATIEIVDTYDIHVDSTTNLYCLATGLVTHNSGKSQLLRKTIAYFLAEGMPDIPYKRQENWEGPLLGLLTGKNHKQVSESLIPGILAFFNEDEIKVVKNANYTEKLIHRKTGNQVLIFVHEQALQARERIQSFTAHCAWVDELPSANGGYKLLEEITARVMVLKGQVFMSFTPKMLNIAIKQMIEALEPPVGRKYKLAFVDNPALDNESISTRLQQIAHLPEHMQKTLLVGDWMQGENTVYHLTDYVIQSPINYHPLWRHCVGIDPALSSAQGVVIAAEDPTTGRWYVIYSEKQDKITDVDDAVQRVANLIVQKAINVTKIIYDSAGTYWYMGARKHPVLKNYKIEKPWNKNATSRREDMLSAVQTAIGSTLFVAPYNEDLIEEFNNYSWSETVPGQIVKSQKYHLLDALRYLVDCLPKWQGPQSAPEEMDWPTMVQREIRQYNLESRERAAARRAEAGKPGGWRKQTTTRTWRGSRIQVK